MQEVESGAQAGRLPFGVSPVGGETGELLGEYPYVRFGDGPRTLLVIPGVGDALFDGEFPPWAPWAFGRFYHRFTDSHTIYRVSRPRGLPRGSSISDMADDYVRVLREEFGEADVLGISLGGMIAQALAADAPERVENLVVGVSAYRLGDEKRPLVRTMRERARNRDWGSVRAGLAVEMYTDLRRLVYPMAALGMGPFAHDPADPADPVVSLDAILDYDGSDRLGEIDARTLVVGGGRDEFFPPSVQRETAAGIPDADHRVIEDAAHGAPVERKYEFDNVVRAFLDG